MVTASWIPRIIAGSDMRATPPSRRMSAGTRSSAITAAAPASSAILACSAVTTSMITPPLSISARPALTVNVASSRGASPLVSMGASVAGRQVLQPMTPDAVFAQDGDTFTATDLALGPWPPGALHGGAPAALIAHVVADQAP